MILIVVLFLRLSDVELVRFKEKSGIILISDESEEDEFCDFLDFECLREL